MSEKPGEKFIDFGPTLLEETLAKWRRVHEDLVSFEAKHDYRNTTAYTDTDATSYRRAFELMAGAPRLFGNDLHVTVESSPRRHQCAAAAANGHSH
jgi:hypothetical protein